MIAELIKGLPTIVTSLIILAGAMGFGWQAKVKRASIELDNNIKLQEMLFGMIEPYKNQVKDYESRLNELERLVKDLSTQVPFLESELSSTKDYVKELLKFIEEIELSDEQRADLPEIPHWAKI